jgi:hypothetical protein
MNDQAIKQLIRSLQQQYAQAHGEAHAMSPRNADEMYHQGYQSGRAAALDSVIGTLSLVLAASKEV